jgi:gluconokinase
VNGRGETLVLACSALKRRYREVLREAGPQVAFVYLKVSRETLTDRLRKRDDHFFPAALLESQLETLEPPVQALELDAEAAAEDLAVQILVPFFNRLP